MSPESIEGELDYRTSFGPFDDIKADDVKFVSTAYPDVYSNAYSDFTLDGLGALVDGEYMEPPILGFRVDAIHDSERIGYALAGYSVESGVGYSGLTKVEEPYRRSGLGSELLQQKLWILGKLGAHTVHSMVTSEAGRRLVDSHGFSYNEPLTVCGIDEYWTKSIIEDVNSVKESNSLEE